MPPTYRPESRKTRGMEPGGQNRMLQAFMARETDTIMMGHQGRRQGAIRR